MAIPLAVTPRFDELAYREPFVPAWLDRWRAQGDPLADRVVTDLAAAAPLRAIHDLLPAVRERAARGDDACNELLAHARGVPAWVDFAAMRAGQRMIASYAPFMAASLFAGSLVGGAMFYKMALVTGMSGKFATAPTQRLVGTTAMVMRLAFPRAIQPGGAAHDLLLRVRLLHAGLRRVLVDSGRFRHPHEVPINQHDLAITLALFGYVNVRNLLQLEIRLDRAQIDSFMHLWRYAGHVLGIAPELLPDSIEAQQAFYFASCKHQVVPAKVMAASRDVLDAVAKKARLVPYPVAQTFLHQLTRYLAGGDYITGMGIADRGNYWGLRAARGLGRIASVVHDRVPLGEQLMYRAGAQIYRRELARGAHPSRSKRAA